MLDTLDYDVVKANIQAFHYTCVMAEAGIDIYIATAGALAIVTAIQFAERSYRYRRLKDKKYAGTMGFEYESSSQEGSK